MLKKLSLPTKDYVTYFLKFCSEVLSHLKKLKRAAAPVGRECNFIFPLIIMMDWCIIYLYFYLTLIEMVKIIILTSQKIILIS